MKKKQFFYQIDGSASAVSVGQVPGGLLFRTASYGSTGNRFTLQFIPCSSHDAYVFMEEHTDFKGESS